MKTFIAAVLIFALLLLGVFWNMHYLTQKLTGILKALDAIPLPDKEAKDLTVQCDALRLVEEDWRRSSTGISMSVNHADLMETEVHFAAARAAAEADNRDNYLVALGEVSYSVSHLLEMSQLTLKNLI